MTTVSQPMIDPFAASRYPTPPFSPPLESPRTSDGPVAPTPRPRPASAHITTFIPPLSPPSEPLASTSRAVVEGSATAPRKRQSHNPSTLPTAIPDNAQSPEYVLHPAIAAYQAAHPRRPLVGFGPYILLQTLGEGEFGKVKLGVQTEYGEEVAVKLIRRGSVDNQARLSKVEREIEVLKTVRHPNIVRLFDVIETEKYIGIILDFANGGELFDHILAHRYLKEKDAAKLFAQLISGVHYLHRKHIVHRDLKLENLLLDKHRNVIITDFGFANRFEHAKDDLMATSCGSPCYAAPELVISEGLYVGSAVDIWSCGVILYAMLSGYLPFDDDPNNPEGDNINLLYRYIINTPLSFPAYISPEAQDLLRRMLVPDPLRRCDLQTVMAHPWLRAYAPLFDLSVTDLELASQEQLQNKRAASRRDMQARVRLHEQANQKSVLARSQSSRPGLGGVTAAGLEQQHRRAREPRHHSTLPGATTMPHDLHRAAEDPSTSPPAVKRAKTDFDAASGLAGASTQARTPERVTPPRSRTTSLRSSPSRDAVAQTTEAAQLPPAERLPASANPNRHTIQVEFNGIALYGLENRVSEGRDLEGPAQAVQPSLEPQVLSEISANQPQTVPPSKGDSKSYRGSSPSQSSASSVENLNKASSGAASPPATPKALKGARQIDSDPTPKASEQKMMPPPRTIPPPRAPTFRPGQLPPPPPSLDKRERTRKGMSMDKFGLGKLLGVATSVNIDRTKPVAAVSSNKADAQAGRSKEAHFRSDSIKQSRRKTLTLMVADPFTRTTSKTPPPRSANAPATRLEHSGSSTSTAGSRPTSMVVQADRIVSPGPHERSPSSPSVTTVEAFAGQDATKADDGANQRSASSSAAKKVMDWFRRKSLAKETLSHLQMAPVAAPQRSPASFTRISLSQEADTEPQIETPRVPVGPTIQVSNEEGPVRPELRTNGEPVLEQLPTTRAGASQTESFDSRLKIHSGVVDQSALTSRPVPEVLADVLRVLRSMGIDVKKESDFRLRCTRARRRKSGATTGLGLSSVMSKSSSGADFPSSASTSSIDRRGLPLPSSTSGLLANASGGIKGMLLRRGSSYNASPSLDVTGSTGTRPEPLASPSGSSTGLASPGQPISPLSPEPLYGEHSLDGGDEIRFSVEITRIRNLPGLYSLDIKRLRGNVWSFKFVYQTILDRSETLTH